jgi:micrococcal nuclease
MRWATAVGIATTVTILGSCTQPTDGPDGRATVTHVVDGDTIDVRIGGREERVRLIGIDTPETKKPDTPIECFGPEASAFTASILPAGAEVRIERDVVGRDDYGRLLGYVHKVGGDGSADLFVNREIIARGYAVPLAIEPNTVYAGDFAAAAHEAETADFGLWAACRP